MSTKPNPRDRLAFRKLTIVCGLILAIPVAVAKEAPQQTAYAPVWEQWRPLAQGFIARRKVPARLELPVTERRAPETQPRELGRSAAVLGASGKMAAASGVSAATSGIGQTSSAWLYTDEAGLYSVSLSELAEQTGIVSRQLLADARSGRLEIANEGAAVAWYFDPPNGRLLFTGEAYETFVTEGNAYLLRETQGPDPQLMTQRTGKKPAAAGAQTPFREVLHFEEEGDMMYFTWLDPENSDARYWFWDNLFGSYDYKPEIDIPLRIPNPAPQGVGRVLVRLQGYTDFLPGDDHRVVALLNGVQIGSEIAWDGLKEADLVADFDQGLLKTDGDNTLTLHSSQGGQLLAWVDVDYDRLPVANNGQLWLRNVSGGVQAVSGFASKDILVIESPVRDAVVRRDIKTYASGDGFAVAFQAIPGSDYLVAETGSPKAPVIDAGLQADLISAENEADYLIIAPREFSATAEALAAHRRTGYGAVKIAWLDDVYKAFGFGREDPLAFRAFLDHVRTRWASAPSAVILVGKGSLDRKDTMGYGDNFVPVLMTANPWALAESDARLLGDESGEGGLSFGRLPITNDAEGVAYVEKLIAHELQLGVPAGNGAVVVADNNDKAGDFHAGADALAAQLQLFGSSPITKLYHPEDAVRANLIQSATWNTGFVSYSGHGSTSQIGNNTEKFLTAVDAAALGNSAYYPMFAALTCAAGSDALPGTRSLASALVLNPQGGAIASLAPSGLSLDSDAHALGGAFIDRLYGDGSNIGGALAAAKLDTNGQIGSFMAPMYSVTGDPAVFAR